MSSGIYMEKADPRDLLLLFFHIIPIVYRSLSFQLKWNLELITIFLENTVVSKYGINSNVSGTVHLQMQKAYLNANEEYQ